MPSPRDGDLAQAVIALRDDMELRYGLQVEVEWPDSPYPLPLVTAVTLYRFFQESLLNVIKHADVDDARCYGLSNAWEQGQHLRRGGIEIDDRYGRVRRRFCAHSASSTQLWYWFTKQRHENLLPIRDAFGQVDAGRIGGREQSAGGANALVYARPRAQMVEAGTFDRTRNIHHRIDRHEQPRALVPGGERRQRRARRDWRGDRRPPNESEPHDDGAGDEEVALHIALSRGALRRER